MPPDASPAPASLLPLDAHHAFVDVDLDAQGVPSGATAALRIAAPPSRVWSLVRAVDRYAQHVPMIDESKREGDRVTMNLRFKVALFSARFAFVARIVEDPEKSLELRYVSGEPKDILIRFALAPEPDSDGQATRLTCVTRFDVQSLGWLVKFFLRHHPEIQFGIYPGTALALAAAVRQAAV